MRALVLRPIRSFAPHTPVRFYPTFLSVVGRMAVRVRMGPDAFTCYLVRQRPYPFTFCRAAFLVRSLPPARIFAARHLPLPSRTAVRFLPRRVTCTLRSCLISAGYFVRFCRLTYAHPTFTTTAATFPCGFCICAYSRSITGFAPLPATTVMSPFLHAGWFTAFCLPRAAHAQRLAVCWFNAWLFRGLVCYYAALHCICLLGSGYRFIHFVLPRAHCGCRTRGARTKRLFCLCSAFCKRTGRCNRSLLRCLLRVVPLRTPHHRHAARCAHLFSPPANVTLPFTTTHFYWTLPAVMCSYWFPGPPRRATYGHCYPQIRARYGYHTRAVLVYIHTALPLHTFALCRCLCITMPFYTHPCCLPFLHFYFTFTF